MLKMPIAEIAEKFGASRQTLHAILGERQAITPEMALRAAEPRE